MSIKLVTIFGGSGFIGRYLTQILATKGIAVRVAVRAPAAANFCRPMGNIGQVTPIQANIRDMESVKSAVAGVDAVINLVGIIDEVGRQKFDAVNHIGAANIATAVADAGIKKLIHISALGADKNAKAAYNKSKAAGEAAVLSALPTATIMRPAVVFGSGDHFFNKFGKMTDFLPFLPLIDGGKVKFQPVYVKDLADAIVNSLLSDGQQDGKIYEIAGPKQYSFRQIMEMTLEQCAIHRGLVPMPSLMLMPMAWLLDLLPIPMPISVNKLQMLKTDNIPSGDFAGLDDLNIKPTAAELILPSYMVTHRQGGQYNIPSV